MRSSTFRAVGLAIGMCAAGGACAGKAAPQQPKVLAATTGKTRQIHVAAPAPDFEITDSGSSDIEELVIRALVLTDRGDFAAAGVRFQGLAEGQFNPFGEVALRSAAWAYLQAGEWERFLAVMRQLRARLGAERLAVAPLEIEVLLALEAFYGGDPVSPPRELDPIWPRQPHRKGEN